MEILLPAAGDLNRRIVIKLWTDVPNAAFGLDQTFDAGIGRWAKVEPVHGIALRAGMNTEEIPTHLFWVRYTPGTRPEDLTASHVIEWNGRRYRVMNSVDINDSGCFTRISAKDLGAL